MQRGVYGNDDRSKAPVEEWGRRAKSPGSMEDLHLDDEEIIDDDEDFACEKQVP